MSVRLRSVGFASDDPLTTAAFWAKLLGRTLVQEGGVVRVPGDDTQIGLRFVPRRARRTKPNRMHIHLTSTSLEDQRARVTAALTRGARHLDVGQQPEEQHVVLADPGGNPFCVIEPGNSFLANTGLLGELACEGSREVGVFWSEAMGWPLVWDEHGETAIQSPQGGTKIAWGGPPVLPVDDTDIQHFELVAYGNGTAAEVDRLVTLGAARRHDVDGVLVLADPDGLEFRLAAGAGSAGLSASG